MSRRKPRLTLPDPVPLTPKQEEAARARLAIAIRLFLISGMIPAPAGG